MSDKALWSVAHNKKNPFDVQQPMEGSYVTLTIFCTLNYVFLHLWTQYQTSGTTLLDTVDFTITISNVNIMNNCEIPNMAWTISCYYRQKKHIIIVYNMLSSVSNLCVIVIVIYVHRFLVDTSILITATWSILRAF